MLFVRASICVLCLGLAACPTPSPFAYTTSPLTDATDGCDLLGYLLGSPVGITTASDPTIQVHCAGFDPDCDGILDPPPRFDKIPVDWLGAVPGEPPILAMSLGIDVIYVETKTVNGTQVAMLRPGNHGWIAIEFAVHLPEPNSEQGLAPCVLCALERGELHRTVFSYVTPDSIASKIPPEGNSVCSLGPNELGLPSAADRIEGLSMHVGMYHTDLIRHPNFFNRQLPKNPTIYFTLRPAFLLAMATNPIVAAWFAGATPDSSTILKSTWNGTTWTMPQVHRTGAQLGLLPSAVIDGLSIDIADVTQGSPAYDEEIMFSTLADFSLQATQQAVDEQIRYARFTAPPPSAASGPLPVYVGGSEYDSLGSRLGGGRGIGDFCTMDPEHGLQGRPGPNAKPWLDDFFVARRMPPVDNRGLVALPYGSPRLRLSVASYRQVVYGNLVMRTCMSFPLSTFKAGDALLSWGTLVFPGDSITWIGSQPFSYVGKPLSFDIPIDDRTPSLDRALVAQWSLRVGHRLLVAPLSVLRY